LDDTNELDVGRNIAGVYETKALCGKAVAQVNDTNETVSVT
jgi:hypothetical protein